MLSLCTCCPDALIVDSNNMHLAAPWVRILPYRQNNSKQLYFKKENCTVFYFNEKLNIGGHT